MGYLDDTGLTRVWGKFKENISSYKTIENTSIASFTDGSNLPLKSLTADITAIQDLHGYDYPWVGGSGKNKLKDDLYYDRTLNGVTFARQADGGIKITGTATQNFRVNYSNTVALKTGQYILSGGTTKVEVALQGFGYVTTTEKSITVESDSTYEAWLYLYGDTAYNTIIYPMLRPSNTDSTFAPYSNICPISGWSACNVVRTGKNLVYKTIPKATISNNGKFVITSSLNTDMQIAQVKKDKIYTITSDELFVGGFFTSEPTNGSNTYNNSRWADTPRTFTAPIDGYVAFRTSNGYLTPQMELGTQSTTYSAYSGNTYSLTFTDGSNPLTVYGGTVDLVSGVLTVDRAYVDLGSLTWVKGNAGSDYLYPTYFQTANTISDIEEYRTSIIPDLLCSQYRSIQADANYNLNNDGVISTYLKKIAVVDSSKVSFTSDQFQSAMQGVQSVYELATPLTYQLSKQQIKSLVGENNIFADTGAIKKVEYQPDNIVGEIREDIDAITDDKVKQTNTTTDASYNVLFSSSTNTTTEKTEGTRKSANLQFNPNKPALTVGTRGTGDVGAYSYTFGYGLKATNSYTHAEGYLSEANGQYSHAEGSQSKTTSGAWYQHAEGQSTTASGDASHSEGGGTTAVGDYSHAQGLGTYATSKSQHVFGEYNIKDGSDSQRYRGEYVEIVGCGTSDADADRADARRLKWTGDEWLLGALTTTDVIKTAKWDGTNTSLQTAITAIRNSLPTSTTSNGWYITKFPNIKFAICRYVNTTQHPGGTKSYSTARSPFTFKNATVSVSAMVAGTVETQIKYTNVATNGVEAYVYSNVTSETNARVTFTVFTDYD